MTALPRNGFTLIELVVVMMILGVVATLTARFVSLPLQGYIEQARRAELTDNGALALLRMSRDIRAALPNSLRAGSSTALELLVTLDGQRYRAEAPGSADDQLSFTAADSAFNTLGVLGGSAPVTYTNHFLAIYPLGQTGAVPYSDPVMTPSGTTISVSAVASPGPAGTDGEYRIGLSVPHLFPLASPGQRVFLVSGAASYVCAGGELRRHEGYGLRASQPLTAAAIGNTGVLMAEHVESCNFSYVALDARRSLVRMEIVLEDRGERVRLARQVHVDNTP